MALRKVEPMTFKARGCSDAVDGTNTFPGSMQALQDLVPSPSTANNFVPRPASTQLTNFAGFTGPANVNALFVVGSRAYGMIASTRFAGKDEPFCYDLVGGAFVTIGNVTAANCPTSPATAGDWTPPTMAMVGNKIMITHPGYSGVTNFVGWIDLRNFSSTGITGATHTSTLVDGLSTNVLIAGWQVGDLIAGAGIPANTYIAAINAAGTSLTLSQAATATAAGVALTVTSGSMASPVYGAGQVNGNGLAAVPVAVFNFNNRAYYAVSNGVQFSDAAQPLQQTNASQQITLGDNTAVTALAGLPLTSQVVGGVIQSVIAFKGAGIPWQITGDPATTNLTANAISGGVGTLAPNSVCATPKGLAFIAPDGLRVMSETAQVSDVIGADGMGISRPFQWAVNPSRMAAAYNAGVLRVSVRNGLLATQPTQEWWYHLSTDVWTGPHSFPSALIEAYTGGGDGQQFVLAATGINAKLWQSSVRPNSGSTYTENSVAMTWAWQTSLLPDNEQNVNNTLIQSTQGYALPSTETILVLAVDETGNQLDQLTISGQGAAGAVWGSFTWGSGIWGTAQGPFEQYGHAWHLPICFKQMTLRVTGQSIAGFEIGNAYGKVQRTSFMLGR